MTAVYEMRDAGWLNPPGAEPYYDADEERMGTYTTQEFLDTFGGLPDRDEAAVDLDAYADQLRDEDLERELELSEEADAC